MTRILLAVVLGLLVRSVAAEKPNIVLVLTDDTGLSRISCYGGGPFKTPELDKLAATGLRFERAYSMPICGPSRAALLTGKYPFRTGAVDNNTSVIDVKKHTTLALAMKQAGYVTCTIGKLGQIAPEDDMEAPGRLGFDEYMLWMGRGTPDRYWKPRYHRNGQIVQGNENEYGPDLTHDFVVDFMKRNREKPFFVYYSAVLTHFPFGRTPDSTDDTKHVQDMVAYMDKQMGRLVTDLEKLGLREKTILIFTSDNGPQGNPLGTIRGAKMVGAKGDVQEGGVRTPLIVNCPGRVPAGKVCGDLTDFTDLFPSVLELAGAKVEAEWKLDGRSVAAQMLGERGTPREWVYAQHGRQYFMADQQYKLYGDGRFVDIADSPVAEKAIESPDEAAGAAKKRLAGALAELRAGVVEAVKGPARASGVLRPNLPPPGAQRVEQLRLDLAVLKDKGIIADVEEWLAAGEEAKTLDGAKVGALAIKAAGQFKPAANLEEALQTLVEQGVIMSATYWKKNAVSGGTCGSDNVARLINKLAQKLGGGK